MPPTRRAVLFRGLLTAAVTAGPARAQDATARAAALNGQHPAAAYRAAAELFGQGRREDATFLFYLGQLRYRTHLAARPNLPRDGDPALFASLSETVGRPINEWAFGDIPALLRTLDAVLAYDARNPDAFTKPADFPAQTREVRDGLRGLRAQLVARAAEIRRQRAANGLENR